MVRMFLVLFLLVGWWGEKEEHTKIRCKVNSNLIKDPNFRGEKDEKTVRVLSARKRETFVGGRRNL